MATKYNTGNAGRHCPPRDLNDNSVNIDEWANSQSKNSHPDRLGGNVAHLIHPLKRPFP